MVPGLDPLRWRGTGSLSRFAAASYKKRERQHADAQAQQQDFAAYIPGAPSWAAGLSVWARAPHEFCEQWLLTNCRPGERLLDYGCGQGGVSLMAARHGVYVEGIDIAPKAVAFANYKAEREGVAEISRFSVADCEQLPFPSRHFDVAVSANVLPALQVERAVAELTRVLKPTGRLVVVEMLGHNPVANLNRRINCLRGLRTRRQTTHILRMADLARLGERFRATEYHYFDLTTLLVGGVIGGRRGRLATGLAATARALDRRLLSRRWLQRYAFKVVCILSGPKQ